MEALRRILRPRPSRAFALLLAGFGLLAGAWGCDIFKPRTPEAPLVISELHVSYVEPESTLETMARAIENRTDAGVSAYVGALADTSTDKVSFFAFFDAAAAARWQATSGKDPPAEWNLDRERNFVGIFLTSKLSGTTQVLWQQDQQELPADQVGPDATTLYRRYTVLAVLGATTDTVAIGWAGLTFAKISPTRWAVTRWEDHVAPEIGANPANTDHQSFSARRLDTY